MSEFSSLEEKRKEMVNYLNNKGKVYLASPWFNDEQMERCEWVRDMLKSLGFDVFSPKDEALAAPDDTMAIRQQIFDGNVKAIKECSFMVCISNGKDMGCFTGDTKIELLDGRSIRIDEMVENEEGYWVYSINKETGKVEPGFTLGSKKTKLNSELVAVELDNGEVIRCTPDHPFMLRNGDYIEAQDLVPGVSLMPLYLNKDLFYKEYYDPFINEWESVYRMSAKWKYDTDDLYNFRYEDGQYPVIHHSSFDHTNDIPVFLERLGNKDHIKLHSEVNRKEYNGSEKHMQDLVKLWSREEYREKMLKLSIDKINAYNHDPKYEESRIKNRERARKQFKELQDSRWNPENPDYYSEKSVAHREKIKESSRKSLKERIASGAINISENNRKLWSDPEYKKRVGSKIAETLKVRMKGEGNPAYGRKWIYHEETGEVKFIKKEELEKYISEGWSLGMNHEVVSVTPLDHNEDVYGIQVDDNHNYALSAGVFVSNTIFESGVAYAFNVPIVYFAEGLNGPFNLMLAQSGKLVCSSRESLKSDLSEPIILMHLLCNKQVSDFDGKIE